MSGDDDVVMVDNTYKSALEGARSTCLSPAARLESALGVARTAMSSGAWGGPKGEDFSGELDRYRRKLNDAGPDAISAFDSAISAQPERVPSTAWQVRWHQMAPR